MATIMSPGIGSGLDVNSIVTQLMSIERRPLDLLDQRKSDLDAQISAYGKLKGAFATFQAAMRKLETADRFQIFSTSSSDEAVATAKAGPGAAAGTVDVAVSQLAARHKIASGPYASAALVGTGTLTISVGAESFDVAVAGGSGTLSAIRDAINSAPGNTGVTATLLNDTAGTRLVLTAKETGTANALQVSVVDDDGQNADATGLSALTFLSGGTQRMSEVRAAADALLTIDGFDVVSASNSVSDAVTGVTLDLKAVGSATIDFARDDSAIQKSVQEFADAFNALRTTISDLRKGKLAGDANLTSIEGSLLGVLGTAASLPGSAFTYLAEIGVSLDKNGKMQVDANRLSAAMSADFDGVTKLFTDETQGFVGRLSDLATNLTGVDGILALREEGLSGRVRAMASQRIQIERRLEITEQRLRAQFTALDTLVSQLQSTSAFLTQQLSRPSSS